MAKELVFSLSGATYGSIPIKLERKKICKHSLKYTL